MKKITFEIEVEVGYETRAKLLKGAEQVMQDAGHCKVSVSRTVLLAVARGIAREHALLPDDEVQVGG